MEPDDVEVLVLMELFTVTGAGSGAAGAGAILAGIFGLISCLGLGSTLEPAGAVVGVGVGVAGLVCNFKVVFGLVSMEIFAVEGVEGWTGAMAIEVAKEI